MSMKAPHFHHLIRNFALDRFLERDVCSPARCWKRIAHFCAFLMTFTLLCLFYFFLSPSFTSAEEALVTTSTLDSVSQIRVLSDGLPVAGAFVYYLLPGQIVGAEPLTNEEGEPLITNIDGYLEDHSPLTPGERLVALLPITATEAYTLYHTSASPNETGLDMLMVTGDELLELQLSPANPLLLFNLDVSLEWDARHDDIFRNKLNDDLQRASEILYDLSNGQVALGKVRVFHAKENWLSSHILIYASNNVRPSAALGGIATGFVEESLVNGEVITDAYLPGQVRMSAIWNRFGNPIDEVGEDWPRTLAHELGHYLLFMPDNYLGLSEDRVLIRLDCQGSAMTDAYREDYSEFLTSAEWTGDCLDTLAQHTTGRPDWQTIKHFYPMFNADEINVGPTNLPLNVTQISFIEPETPANTLLDPFFHVTDAGTNPLPLPFGQAQGYLFKTRGTAELTDDTVIPVGSPIGDLLRVRGAEAGDRLCLFDYGFSSVGGQASRRLGCLEEISQSSTNLSLIEVPEWQPQIMVHGVTSRTLTITVTQAIISGQLNVQILPSLYPTATEPLTAPVATMIAVGNDTFSQTITLDYPIYNGFVRIWQPGMSLREEINEFFITTGWGPPTDRGWGPPTDRGWGPPTDRGWGPNRNRYGWMAPIRHRDGQVTIFDLEHIFGGNPAYALQSLPVPPNLPPWLTQVGQAYRFSVADEMTGTLSIMFEYMQREVPGEREDRLRIYYSPDEGQSWQLLPPTINQLHNLASAHMPGEGIYMLVSTIEIPLFGPGLNNIAYLAETKPIRDALASIDNAYQLVANYKPSRPEPWHLYDPRVPEAFFTYVNTLTELEFEEVYWIYATESITLYLGSPENPGNDDLTINSLQAPPALYYGSVTPSTLFTPTLGMPVRAWINGHLCGETSIEEWNGELAYKVQVMGENVSGVPNGCGLGERFVQFQVGEWLIPEEMLWDNSQATFHPLGELADMMGYISLQGRLGPPTGSFSTFLAVTLTLEGESEPTDTFTVTTNEAGSFTLTNIPIGSYEITVKKPTALANSRFITLTTGLNEIDFGLLREGDANNDNVVSLLDFSILATAFGKCTGSPGFDERADFNGDGCILINDFSLLATNFGQIGDGY